MSDSRRRVRALVVLLSVAAVPAAWALPASADGGGGHGSGSRGIVGPLSSTATCPAGERAISGGWDGDPGSSVPSSHRSAPDTWTVETSDSGTASQAKVVCSDSLRAKEVRVSGDFPGDSSEQLALVARCPEGLRPVGGGWDYANDATVNSPVFTSRPVKRGWKVKAFANDGDANALDVFAYCARMRTDVRRQIGDVTSQPTSTGASATCPSGQSALGGGYSTSPRSDFYNNDGPDFFYYSSRRSGGRTWGASAVNYSSYPDPVHATAYVVCTT